MLFLIEIDTWVITSYSRERKRDQYVINGVVDYIVFDLFLQMTAGQVNMRDARVEDVDHVSDSDEDEKDEQGCNNLSSDAFTVGIFPTHESPVYLHCVTKQEKVCYYILFQGCS
jgi:hypothetical protein